MEWKGLALLTWGDITNAMVGCQSREEAQAFMRLYRAENPQGADSNVGYLSGYYSAESAARILDWFDVSHPIFGKTQPSMEEAFEAGKRMAAQLGPALDSGEGRLSE